MKDEPIWTITMCEHTMAVLIIAFALWIFLTMILLRHYVNSERVKPMYYTDDPARDFERWEAAQEAKLERLPKCADCGNPIQDETAFYINGEWICEECMEAYRVNTGDYIE